MSIKPGKRHQPRAAHWLLIFRCTTLNSSIACYLQKSFAVYAGCRRLFQVREEANHRAATAHLSSHRGGKARSGRSAQPRTGSAKLNRQSRAVPSPWVSRGTVGGSGEDSLLESVISRPTAAWQDGGGGGEACSARLISQSILHEQYMQHILYCTCPPSFYYPSVMTEIHIHIKKNIALASCFSTSFLSFLNC